MSRETEGTPPITCGCSSATAGPANSRSLHNMWLLERHSGPGQLPQPPITYAPRHASTRARHHRCVRFRKTKQHSLPSSGPQEENLSACSSGVLTPVSPALKGRRGAKLVIPRPKVFSSCMENAWIQLDPITCVRESRGSNFCVFWIQFFGVEASWIQFFCWNKFIILN